MSFKRFCLLLLLPLFLTECGESESYTYYRIGDEINGQWLSGVGIKKVNRRNVDSVYLNDNIFKIAEIFENVNEFNPTGENIGHCIVYIEGTFFFKGEFVSDEIEYISFKCKRVSKEALNSEKESKSKGNTQDGILAFEKGDYQTAYQEFLTPAKNGEVLAQKYLGNIFLEGLGVKQDIEAAIGWFELAANQGDPEAAKTLGLIYDQGFVVQQDYEQAYVWFYIGAQEGDTISQSWLGNYYKDGLGGISAADLAWQYYSLAVLNGFSEAQIPKKIIEGHMHEQMILNALFFLDGSIESTKKGDFNWIKNISAIDEEVATKFPYQYKRIGGEVYAVRVCEISCEDRKYNGNLVNGVSFIGFTMLGEKIPNLPIPKFFSNVAEYTAVSESEGVCIISTSDGQGIGFEYKIVGKQEFYFDDVKVNEDIEKITFGCKKINPVPF